MKRFPDKRQKIVFSDDHASVYFSRAAVFVEGASEKELFTHPHLVEMFPELRQIDFFSFDSNNVTLRCIYPRETNLGTPYFVLLDLDKLIKYNRNLNKFEFTQANEDFEVNPFNDERTKKKEVFYYGEKRVQTLMVRKRIEGLIQNSFFTFDPNWGYGGGMHFAFLKDLIHSYCSSYSIFTVDTTCEGMLINSNNHSIVYDWLIKSNPSSSNYIDKVYRFKSNSSYQVTAFRLMHGGKYDNLLTKKELIGNHQKLQDNSLKNNYESIYRLSKNKTEGWITELLNYFFEEKANGLTGESMTIYFQQNFPELYKSVSVLRNLASQKGE
jgi:hypothetical protein